MGAILGTMISMSLGLRMTMGLAALLYGLAALAFSFTFRQLGQRKRSGWKDK
jgi:predicted MFS family arabinose efflux permease